MKLGDHQAALRILVANLGDSTSAETYCTLGGDIIPPKTAQSIAVDAGLKELAVTLYGLPATDKSKSVNGKGAISPKALSRAISANENLKKDLVKILLEVYMSVQCVFLIFSDALVECSCMLHRLAERASHLLNTQAMNLDVLDVRLTFLTSP